MFAEHFVIKEQSSTRVCVFDLLGFESYRGPAEPTDQITYTPLKRQINMYSADDRWKNRVMQLQYLLNISVAADSRIRSAAHKLFGIAENAVWH